MKIRFTVSLTAWNDSDDLSLWKLWEKTRTCYIYSFSLKIVYEKGDIGCPIIWEENFHKPFFALHLPITTSFYKKKNK